jgi:2-iminoacetate synthase
MSFQEVFNCYTWDQVKEKIYQKTEQDVKVALNKNGRRSLDDFMALISPVAVPFIEEMAQLSQQITKKRFGNTIGMYIPLYLSNECQNICTYCGFSINNKIDRLTLNKEQILQEIKMIKSYGFDHVLLVTGETSRVQMDYFKEVIELIRPYFSQISMEVQPLSEEEYAELNQLGLNGIFVYQETYGPRYDEYHPRGKKSKFEYRLDTPDRLGKAGIHKVGIGCLIGLDDWRTDSFFTALHLDYLDRKYWKTKYSISFPRLRPAEGCLTPAVVMTDPELVQLICAYRIFNENVELSLSTRETSHFRDHVFPLGITAMSAGSKTEPGGYSINSQALEQFAIEDTRTPQEVATMIQAKGYEAVWKDWDSSL